MTSPLGYMLLMRQLQPKVKKKRLISYKQSVQLSVGYFPLVSFNMIDHCPKRPTQTGVKDLESVCNSEEVTCLSESNEEEKVFYLNVMHLL